MTIQRINQVDSGIDKLLSQFRGKDNIENTLRSYLEQVQETQGAYEEMLDERDVLTAVGVQLDHIGNLVGEDRKLREDDAYRTAIFIRIAVNTNNGTLPDLHAIIKLLTGAEEVRIAEHFPASVYVYLYKGMDLTTAEELINLVLPAGVGLGYIGYDDNLYSFTPFSQVIERELLIDYTSDTIVTDEDEEMLVLSPLFDPIALDSALTGENNDKYVMLNGSTLKGVDIPEVLLTGDFQLRVQFTKADELQGVLLGHSSNTTSSVELLPSNKLTIKIDNTTTEVQLPVISDNIRHRLIIWRRDDDITVSLDGTLILFSFTQAGTFYWNTVGKGVGGGGYVGSIKNANYYLAIGEDFWGVGAEYPLDDGFDNNPTARDTSGNSNHGTFTNVVIGDWVEVVGTEPSGFGICAEILETII